MDEKTIKLLRYTSKRKTFTKFYAWAVLGRYYAESLNYLIANQMVGYLEHNGTVYYQVTIKGRAAYDTIRYERKYNSSTRTISVISLLVSIAAIIVDIDTKLPRLLQLLEEAFQKIPAYLVP